MRVKLHEIQAYSRRLAKLAEEAQTRVDADIALWMSMNPSAETAECREFAIAAVDNAIRRYGDAAATDAAALFDEVMAGEGVDVPAATIYDGHEAGRSSGTVHRLAGMLTGDDPDRDGFREQVSKFTADETRRAARETIAENVGRAARTKRGGSVRFARMPRRAVPCPWCVMLASRGFDFTSVSSAAAGNHHNCTCVVVPGVKGKTEIEGYDIEAYRRWYGRLEGSEVVHESFYAENKAEIRDIASQYDRELRRRKGLYDTGIKDAETYREQYASFVTGRGSGSIEIDDFTFIEGKELQLAEWFADSEHAIRFRNADDNKDDTSDVTIDGEKWEFKRVSSPKIAKLSKGVTGRLDTQGPNFVVDLSVSDMSLDHARTKIVQLLDDPRIERVMLVSGGRAELFGK